MKKKYYKTIIASREKALDLKNEAIRGLEKENFDLRQRNRALERMIEEDIGGYNARNVQEIATLKGQLASMENPMPSLMASRESLRQNVDRLCRENNKLRIENEKMRQSQDCAQTRQWLENCQKDIQEMEKENERLKERISGLEYEKASTFRIMSDTMIDEDWSMPMDEES